MEFAKYLPVFLGSMVKFIIGPITGAGFELTLIETSLLTAAGMMTTVVIITFAGTELRAFLERKFAFGKNKKEKKSKFQHIWEKYGVFGIAFLTPILLSPIAGALLAAATQNSRRKIILYMLISAVIWGFILSAGVKYIFFVPLNN